MRLDQPIKYLELDPPRDLVNYDFDRLDPSLWVDNNQLIKRQGWEQLSTLQIRSVHPADIHRPEGSISIEHNLDLDLRALCILAADQLAQYYQARPIAICLNRLGPGGAIAQHWDRPRMYSLAHRVHLPLKTNAGSQFIVDGRACTTRAGQYFEFDNQRDHSVVNGGSLERIHLIIDLLPTNLE